MKRMLDKKPGKFYRDTIISIIFNYYNDASRFIIDTATTLHQIQVSNTSVVTFRYQELISIGMRRHSVQIHRTILNVNETGNRSNVNYTNLKVLKITYRNHWSTQEKTEKTRSSYIMRILSRCAQEKLAENLPGIRQMKAWAIKFSLEGRHVLPRVWRDGHGDRDLEIADIAHYATNRRPSYAQLSAVTRDLPIRPLYRCIEPR